jgi:hypothetical protein
MLIRDVDPGDFLYVLFPDRVVCANLTLASDQPSYPVEEVNLGRYQGGRLNK